MNSRVYIKIMGAVQGVGFRPFIYRLASEMNLKGFVLNSSKGVQIEAESTKENLDKFVLRINNEKPSLSVITSFEFSFLDPAGYNNFEIKESKNEDETSALILPDIALCKDCLNEMLDPNNRRYLYPFINCTNCGPRFSIIESLPYDRPNTSMKIFEMCEDCRKEYEDPLNRRFHAQPIACPKCGPHIELWDKNGKVLFSHEASLKETVKKIKEGFIIALKGIGGYQLIVDARNDDAVNKLRLEKNREEKPFALMFPDINSVKEICEVSLLEERLLQSPESPIVLLKKKSIRNNVSKFAAPNNPYLGVMLPYSPLHYLLLNELKTPIVATSGNLSEEPICIDEEEALTRLNGIADYFLTHNRPIVRHVDDSIARIILDREMVLRRARGFAPLPVQLKNNQNDESYLAVGGHLKNAIALKVKNNIIVSQYIGDLSTKESFKTFTKVIDDFQKLYKIKIDNIIADEHPEYLSTKYAKSLNLKLNKLQHHYAHIASCRAENQIEGNALGISWDGTGFGLDNTIWGGEFFLSKDDSFKHIGQFRKFKLPGGEKAIKESKRSAAGLLFEIFGLEFLSEEVSNLQQNFNKKEAELIKQMLVKNINSPYTSSVGRIFDAVSSLIGLSQISNYEGQSAMMLEFSADESIYNYYPFQVKENDKIVVDWENIIREILIDKNKDIMNSEIAAKFHNTLAQVILKIAELVNEEKIIISGGVFQNAFLVERTVKLLQKNNYKVYWHQRIPPNDGGISVGQIAYFVQQNSKQEIKTGDNKNVFSSSR